MPSTVFESKIFRDLLSTEAMRLVFSDEVLIARYIEVEIALARVQGRLGIIPEEAAMAIEEGAKVEIIDLEAMGARAEIVGYPILPLVEQIVAKLPDGLGEWVHWGATTQDIMDTGLVLQLREALALIEADLGSLADILRAMAKTYRDVPMAGRSHMQQALPITFGYKVAVWLSGIERHLKRLHEIRPRVLIAQFAGAAGTLAALGGGGAAASSAANSSRLLRSSTTRSRPAVGLFSSAWICSSSSDKSRLIASAQRIAVSLRWISCWAMAIPP